MNFQIVSKHQPAGDQPKAIDSLAKGLDRGDRFQTLLGVTGSGKTFTIANVIERIQKPTLVIAHNKTLAAQLTNELRALFPKNAVEYFVSYYDYYQPEAYMPASDTYIGKEAMINSEIDKLRHAATTAVLTREDVIVVASVSCIYGLGAPEEYAKNILRFETGQKIDRSELMRQLVSLQYNRTTSDLTRGTFRLRGDQWEIMPPDRELIYLIETSNGKISAMYEINPVEGFNPGVTPQIQSVVITPAKHYITTPTNRAQAGKAIQAELKERIKELEKNKKFLEVERLERRTKADLAMIREVGYCNGIENYSRHLSGRAAGEPPATLLDYFPRKNKELGKTDLTKDFLPGFLTVIDESHVTLPQLRGMFQGDKARKETLIEYGFRLPSAADNRPLRYEEFLSRVGQIIFTSATPGDYEQEKSSQIVEQIIRPTGLTDPKITVRPVKGQVQDLIKRIEERIKLKERVLATTLTKKMAEDLSAYLEEKGIKVNYLHSDVKTLDRIRILTDLRRGTFDVVVGVNLLREGLDLPEVSLVAILDADKEGFLRSETSLIQTIGRAARNANGEVVLYADQLTGSLTKAIKETERRREIQLAYNKANNITPRTIQKEITDILPGDISNASEALKLEVAAVGQSPEMLAILIKSKEKEMRNAARNLDFELAALLRDEIKLLNTENKKLKFGSK